MKSRFLLRICGILMLCGAASVQCAEEQCTDRPECWPEGSAMRTLLLQGEQGSRLEETLRKSHEELVALVAAAKVQSRGMTLQPPPRLIDALKSQQIAWVKYRDEECELLGALTEAGGQWPSAHATRCSNNLTDLRLKRIQAARSCILRIPEESRLFGQANCLQQLAPLVNH